MQQKHNENSKEKLEKIRYFMKSHLLKNRRFSLVRDKVYKMEADEFSDYTTMNEEIDVKELLNLYEPSSYNVDAISRKLNNVMYSACFCGLCIEKDEELTSVYALFHISNVGNMSVLDMLSQLFHDTDGLLASYFICTKCLDNTIQSYKFIQNTKQSANTIHEYINSFESKVITLEQQTEENVDYSNTKFVLLISPNYEGIASVDVDKNGEEIEEESEFQESLNEHTNAPEDEIEDIPIFDEPLAMLPDPIPDINLYIDDENAKVKPIKTKNNAYKCNVCDLIMITFKDWKKHEHTYHKVDNNKPMPCEICFKVITNKRCLLQHYRRHNRDKCKVCKAIIPIVNLKSHMMEEHGMELEEKGKEITDNENQCQMCFRRFKDQKRLEEHPCRYKCSECPENICIHYKYLVSFRQQSLNKSTRFRCPDCNYVCLKRDLLIGHANKAHLNQRYECEFCAAKYFSKNGLKTHIFRCHNPKNICEYCDQEFKNEDEYRTHVQLCQHEKRNVKCSVCVASFNTQEELTHHENLRHKGYPCGLCTKTFTTEHKKREHTSKVHASDIQRKDPNYLCPVCDQRFELRGDRMRHLTTHGPEYTCNVCEEKFENPTMFIRHHYYHTYRRTRKRERGEKRLRATKETEDESMICDTCGKTLRNRAHFLAHRRAHMEPVCCTVCSKMVKATSIYTHMRCHLQQNGLIEKRVYKPVRKYQCEHCSYAGLTRQTIETHINRVHLKVAPYVCGLCNVAYYNKYQLITHENARHNEKTWLKCELCDKVIRCKRAMVKHMMRHTGEKPHICDICSKGFITMDELNEHIKMHTEGKTTICPLCDSMFYSIKHLRLHIKRVHWKHPNKPFNPKLVRGLEEFQFIFQDKRKAVVEQ